MEKHQNAKEASGQPGKNAKTKTSMPPSLKKKGPPPPKFVRPSPKPRDAKKSKNENVAVLGRRLHWDALQMNKIEGTVFQELNRDLLLGEDVAALLDVDQMKRLFAKTGRLEGRRHTLLAMPDTSRKLLTGNRAQNIAIVLSRFPLDTATIAQELETMNANSLISRDILEKLLEIAPLPEERDEYQKFIDNKEDPATLRDVEKKYFPLFRVRRLRERCRGLLAERRFPEVETDIFSMLDLLYKAGSEVRKSQKFRALLVAVLLWGNFVNHGVQEATVSSAEEAKKSEPDTAADSFGRRRRRAGTAALEIRTFGFTLPSLLKLAEFKTTIDPSISSLHYIIANMIQSQPKVELHRLLEEMPSVPEAARIQASALKECLTTLQTEIKCLKAECALPEAEAVYGVSGREHLSSLQKDMENRLAITQSRFTQVTQFVGETAAYFGDAKAKTRSDSHEEFFKTLNLFLIKFKACVSDYQKNIPKFQEILIESAQNRGLTYIRHEGGGEESSATKKSFLVKPKKKSAVPKASLEKLQTTSKKTPDDMEPELLFHRKAARRASVGAVRQNVVLSVTDQEEPAAQVAKPVCSGLENPLATTGSQAALPSPKTIDAPVVKRCAHRRSTAVAGSAVGFYPLKKRMPMGLPPSRLLLNSTDVGLNGGFVSGKALFGNQRKKGLNEDAKKTLVPPSFEAPADPVSDTELELRKVRQYVVNANGYSGEQHITRSKDLDSSPSQLLGGHQSSEGSFSRSRVTRKKTSAEQAVADSAYRHLGRILQVLDRPVGAPEGPTSPKTTPTASRARLPTTHTGVYAAFDEAVEYFLSEHIYGRSLEDFLRLDSSDRPS